MTPLDLRAVRPRPVRASMLGFYLLPRTIDKLRAELPGGDLGEYMNHESGFSAYVVRRAGLEMDRLREAVAEAPHEDALIAWLTKRVDPALAPAINAKLESFVVGRMSFADQLLLRERHPVMAQRPDLTSILDILEADDEYTYNR